MEAIKSTISQNVRARAVTSIVTPRNVSIKEEVAQAVEALDAQNAEVDMDIVDPITILRASSTFLVQATNLSLSSLAELLMFTNPTSLIDKTVIIDKVKFTN